MTSLLGPRKFNFWPFSYKKSSGKAKLTNNDPVIRANTNPIESSIKFEWNIQKFGHMYPNPATYDMCRNVLFKKLTSPSFVVGTDNFKMNPSKWHVELIFDEEPSSASLHYLEISLRLEEFGNECGDKAKTGFIWQPQKDQFAARCQMYLVNDKEEILHSETMAKSMSLTRSKCGFLGFTTLEKIWKEKEKYFADDILRIRVMLTVISETTSQGIGPPMMSKLGSDLADLLLSKNLADVTIRCQSTTFSAHKQILSARCTFFQNMFQSNMVECQYPHVVDIVDIESDICFSFLYYLYTDKLDFLLTDVRKLSALARVGDKYGLEDLKDYCFQCLQVQINLSNAGTLAVLAYFYNADAKTLADIRQFCHTNWNILTTNEEFKKLLEDCPAAFVPSYTRN